MLFSATAEWEYQAATNDVPADPSVVAVPAADWLGPEPAPFGTLGTYLAAVPIATAWAVDTGLWIRRSVTLDGTRGLILSGVIENHCYVYFDGTYVGAINPAGSNRTDVPAFQMAIPVDLCSEGAHTIALLCQDDGGLGAGDTAYIYVEAEYQPALWPFWPRAPMQEMLDWLTDVIVAEDSTEDRAQMRVTPRQSLDMQFFIAPAWQPLAKNLLQGNRTRQWLVPFWPHVQNIGALDAGDWSLTLPTEFVDLRDSGLLLIWQSPLVWQIAGIDRVTNATTVVLSQPTEAFTDAWVVPIRRAFTPRDPVRRFSGRDSVAQIGFVIEENRQLSPAAPTQYLASDIYFEAGLLDGAESTEEMAGQFDLHDEALGRVAYDGPWLHNRPSRQHKMMGDGLEEAWDIREWLHRRAGRFRAFWQPTFEADLVPTSTGALTTALSVRSDGYLAHAADRTHIAVETAAGWLARAITDAVQIDADTVQLTLDTSLAIDAAAIKRVSWLGLRRLDADRVEINWIGGQVCQVSVPTLEVAP